MKTSSKKATALWRVGLRMGVGILALSATACGSDESSDLCRLFPSECAGGAGGLCDDDDECAPGLFCCTDDKNCGDGMCTTDCDDDLECPADMRCEHNKCFYACESDRDCADDMSCEHGKTVCEYP